MRSRSLGAEEQARPLDDDDLQELIVERLDQDPAFHLGSGRRARFDVEVEDGEVTLQGVVRTPLDRRKADIVARALGAATVDNRLRVEQESGTPPARSMKPSFRS